jgi:hypothetical protein
MRPGLMTCSVLWGNGGVPGVPGGAAGVAVPEQDAAGAGPVAGAQHPAVQRLQFLLSESRWDSGQVNARRLELLLADPATAPHGGGVLVIDDSGDRKDGAKTVHMGHQ